MFFVAVALFVLLLRGPLFFCCPIRNYVRLCTPQVPTETPNYSGHFLGDFGAATLAFAFLQAFLFSLCVAAVLLRRHKAMKRKLKKLGLDKESQHNLV